MRKEVIYHTGYLPKDRQANKDIEDKTPKARMIDEAANQAWAFSEAGIVDLVQKRVEEGKYHYIMQYREAA